MITAQQRLHWSSTEQDWASVYAGVPEEIYSIAIFVFLGHLNSEQLTTMVTYENSKMHNRYYRTINLLEFAEKHLKLQNSGEDVMTAGNEVGITELRRYTLNANDLWEEMR